MKNVDYDLEDAIRFNGNPVKVDDIEGIVYELTGENDGQPWHWIVQMKDGSYAYACGGCDFTGWDCQSNLDWHSAPTFAEVMDLVPQYERYQFEDMIAKNISVKDNGVDPEIQRRVTLERAAFRQQMIDEFNSLPAEERTRLRNKREYIRNQSKKEKATMSSFFYAMNENEDRTPFDRMEPVEMGSLTRMFGGKPEIVMMDVNYDRFMAFDYVFQEN